MFDLGVMLTICATGGLDIVAEEDIIKLTHIIDKQGHATVTHTSSGAGRDSRTGAGNYSDKCCLIHALDAINIADPIFDIQLMASLLSLRRVF